MGFDIGQSFTASAFPSVFFGSPHLDKLPATTN
jgi:hypothetical protein